MEDFRRRVSVVRRSAASDLVQGSPQTPILSFPLHQVFDPFRRLMAPDLVHGNPQTLVPPFPLHQVFGPFRRLAVSELVHGFPQALVPPFPLHQVFGPFRRLAVSDLVQEFPQTLVPSFPLHQVPSPDEPHPARTWCSIPRNPLFLRRGAPRPRPRMGLEKEVRTNLPFDCTSFHFYSV